MPTINGSTFADVVIGTGSADLIQALGGDDTILGDAGVDTIYGGDGNDVVYGGDGTDKMYGGLGDDRYYVYSPGEVVSEASNAGTDTIYSNVTFTLGANVEHLTLLGVDNVDGTGNVLANIITGNDGHNDLKGGDGNDSLVGGLGDDTLNGQNGTDTMVGGDGNDLYYVSATTDVVVETGAADIDAVASYVTYTLPSTVEVLYLLGTSAINGTGNAADNVIFGNSAANKIDGGQGDDSMAGGGGGDTYIVDSMWDVIWEDVGAGIDTVMSSVSYLLDYNIENLTLTGLEDNDAYGNDLNNKLTGNAGNNILDGWTGVDTMAGGVGNDIYLVDNAGDVVTEASGGGADIVYSDVSYTLGVNVEGLVLTEFGPILDINGTGNSLANQIYGNSGNNMLNGGTGADTMYGGGGTDTYIVDNVGDVVVAGNGMDTVKSSVAFTLGKDAENLVLTGTSGIAGVGNDLDNYMLGNAGANSLTGGNGDDTLDGGAGSDKLYGGEGGDTFFVNVSTDVVVDTGTTGVDTVISQATFALDATIENLVLTGAAAINGTGNGFDNILTGNEASNILNGGLGADTMYGGVGNDTYVVDNYFDIVFESGSDDTDSVQSSVDFLLLAGIENLTLTGSKAVYGYGNEENNVIVGNSADNLLYGDLGDDTIDGGLGNDKLYGGAGNDTYVVNAAGDVITEDGVGDIDSVKASASYALGDNLEHLTLTGTAAINGTGNELDNWIMGNSGNNVLNGGDGDDTLHGWTGQDKLYGGNGSDLFVVNSTGDMVYDTGASTDVDTVKSLITYTLGSTIENLLLAGAATINGTGNASANWMIGNTANNKLTSLGGNDTLDGGLGNDTMTGGTGSDTFVKHSIAEGLDTITDFQAGWGADVLDIADMLVGYDSLTGNINDFVQFASSGKNTTVMIDVDGTGTDAVFVESIILTGVNNISVDLMLGLGNLVAEDPALVA